MIQKFEELGLKLTLSEGTTGFYTDIDTGRPGPKLLIMGELDALPVPGHPEAAANCCAHACGHHAQCATLYGLALALTEPHVLDKCSGSIRLMAVPAEESLEVSFREQLPGLGISHPSGKVEFLSRGYMDGVDLAFMFHLTSSSTHIFSNHNNNGVMTTAVKIKGHAVHSGTPFNGINALNAATLGIQAVNSNRETLRESDQIRINNVITDASGAVGTVPADVDIANQVRGSSVKAMLDTIEMVKRSFTAGALAIGCDVSFKCVGITMPLNNNEHIKSVIHDVASQLVPEDKIDMNTPRAGGATDMGDLCCVMPVVHMHIAGASGTGHGVDYQVSDPYTGCVLNATAQLGVLVELLENDAAIAKKIVADYVPEFSSVKEFLDFKSDMRKENTALHFEGGKAVLDL